MAGRFSLYPDLSVDENLRFFASVFGTTVDARVRPDRADLLAARGVRGPSRRRAVGRDEAEARPLLRPGASPGHPLSRRADHRRRRRLAARVLGPARTLKTGGLRSSSPRRTWTRRRAAIASRSCRTAVCWPSTRPRRRQRLLRPSAVRRARRARYNALLALRAYPHVQGVYPFGEVIHVTDARRDTSPDDARAGPCGVSRRARVRGRVGRPTRADGRRRLHRADDRGGPCRMSDVVIEARA